MNDGVYVLYNTEIWYDEDEDHSYFDETPRYFTLDFEKAKKELIRLAIGRYEHEVGKQFIERVIEHGGTDIIRPSIDIFSNEISLLAIIFSDSDGDEGHYAIRFEKFDEVSGRHW